MLDASFNATTSDAFKGVPIMPVWLLPETMLSDWVISAWPTAGWGGWLGSTRVTVMLVVVALPARSMPLA